MSSIATPPIRWGTDIEIGTVNGHPCRIYSERPHSLAALLVDAQRWSERPFLVQGGRRLSGARHLQAVARVTDELRRRGVQRGDSVLLQSIWTVSGTSSSILNALDPAASVHVPRTW